MKRIISFLFIIILMTILPVSGFSQVVATILDENISTDEYDSESGRSYARIDYKINIRGAKGHDILLEIPWKDSTGHTIYFNVDTGEEAVTSETYYVDSDDFVIEGWFGPYLDSFMIMPGEEYVITGKLNIIDTTTGKRIFPDSPHEKYHLTLNSGKEAQGIQILDFDQEHNEYRNDAKGVEFSISIKASWLKNKDIRCVVELFKKNDKPIEYMGGGNEQYTFNLHSDYTFTTWNEISAHFPYNGMILPEGTTECYAKLKFYEGKTGKVIPITSGRERLEFSVTRY